MRLLFFQEAGVVGAKLADAASFFSAHAEADWVSSSIRKNGSRRFFAHTKVARQQFDALLLAPPSDELRHFSLASRNKKLESRAEHYVPSNVFLRVVRNVCTEATAAKLRTAVDSVEKLAGECVSFENSPFLPESNPFPPTKLPLSAATVVSPPDSTATVSGTDTNPAPAPKVAAPISRTRPRVVDPRERGLNAQCIREATLGTLNRPSATVTHQVLSSLSSSLFGSSTDPDSAAKNAAVACVAEIERTSVKAGLGSLANSAVGEARVKRAVDSVLSSSASNAGVAVLVGDTKGQATAIAAANGSERDVLIDQIIAVDNVSATSSLGEDVEKVVAGVASLVRSQQRRCSVVLREIAGKGEELTVGDEMNLVTKLCPAITTLLTLSSASIDCQRPSDHKQRSIYAATMVVHQASANSGPTRFSHVMTRVSANETASVRTDLLGSFGLIHTHEFEKRAARAMVESHERRSRESVTRARAPGAGGLHVSADNCDKECSTRDGFMGLTGVSATRNNCLHWCTMQGRIMPQSEQDLLGVTGSTQNHYTDESVSPDFKMALKEGEAEAVFAYQEEQMEKELQFIIDNATDIMPDFDLTTLVLPPIHDRRVLTEPERTVAAGALLYDKSPPVPKFPSTTSLFKSGTDGCREQVLTHGPRLELARPRRDDEKCEEKGGRPFVYPPGFYDNRSPNNKSATVEWLGYYKSLFRLKRGRDKGHWEPGGVVTITVDGTPFKFIAEIVQRDRMLPWEQQLWTWIDLRAGKFHVSRNLVKTVTERWEEPGLDFFTPIFGRSADKDYERMRKDADHNDSVKFLKFAWRQQLRGILVEFVQHRGEGEDLDAFVDRMELTRQDYRVVRLFVFREGLLIPLLEAAEHRFWHAAMRATLIVSAGLFQICDKLNYSAECAVAIMFETMGCSKSRSQQEKGFDSIMSDQGHGTSVDADHEMFVNLLSKEKMGGAGNAVTDPKMQSVCASLNATAKSARELVAVATNQKLGRMQSAPPAELLPNDRVMVKKTARNAGGARRDRGAFGVVIKANVKFAVIVLDADASEVFTTIKTTTLSRQSVERAVGDDVPDVPGELDVEALGRTKVRNMNLRRELHGLRTLMVDGKFLQRENKVPLTLFSRLEMREGWLSSYASEGIKAVNRNIVDWFGPVKNMAKGASGLKNKNCLVDQTESKSSRKTENTGTRMAKGLVFNARLLLLPATDSVKDLIGRYPGMPPLLYEDSGRLHETTDDPTKPLLNFLTDGASLVKQSLPTKRTLAETAKVYHVLRVFLDASFEIDKPPLRRTNTQAELSEIKYEDFVTPYLDKFPQALVYLTADMPEFDDMKKTIGVEDAAAFLPTAYVLPPPSAWTDQMRTKPGCRRAWAEFFMKDWVRMGKGRVRVMPTEFKHGLASGLCWSGAVVASATLAESERERRQAATTPRRRQRFEERKRVAILVVAPRTAGFQGLWEGLVATMRGAEGVSMLYDRSQSGKAKGIQELEKKVYDLTNVSEQIVHDRTLASRITENDDKVLFIVYLGCLFGYTEMNGALRGVKFEFVLKQVKALLPLWEKDAWLVHDDPAVAGAFLKATLMKLFTSAKGATSFRGPGGTFKADGNMLGFNQEPGGEGDPYSATFVDLLKASIAASKYEPGRQSSLVCQEKWCCSEENAEEHVKRSGTGFERIQKVETKDGSRLEMNGFKDGLPVEGESWRAFYKIPDLAETSTEDDAAVSVIAALVSQPDDADDDDGEGEGDEMLPHTQTQMSRIEEAEGEADDDDDEDDDDENGG